MKKRFALITVIIFAVFSFAYYRTAESKRFNSPTIQPENFSEIKAQNVRAVAFGVSGRVSDFAPASPDNGQSGKKSADEQTRAVPNKEPFRKQIPNVVHDSDAAAANFSDAPMPAPSLTFDGVSSSDNAAAYGFRVVPPDPNGDVGPNHYVQSVNILTRVFDKNGTALTPPFKLSSIFSTLGTPCSQRTSERRSRHR